ncbi:MAG: hypothetical protein P4M11_02400 [Candidatus Pacebacteria bacterium]|nr:hypothetical protein [Candidatus Paceibacterota bacterium]
MGSLSGIYVTVIGLFLTSGIFLDLMCGCDDKGEDECCQSNYRTISLGAAPFPIALVWLLATKLVDLFLMKNKNNTKAHQKRRTTQRNRRLQQQNKPGDGFRISAVIIIFAMSVIVVAGLVSTSVYSFRFHVPNAH